MRLFFRLTSLSSMWSAEPLGKFSRLSAGGITAAFPKSFVMWSFPESMRLDRQHITRVTTGDLSADFIHVRPCWQRR